MSTPHSQPNTPATSEGVSQHQAEASKPIQGLKVNVMEPGTTIPASLTQGTKMHQNNITPRPIYEIAREIRKLWIKPNFAAVPYLQAMYHLQDTTDYYGGDDAKSIVLYFLSNASSWRGPDAKRIKLELKQMFGIK